MNEQIEIKNLPPQFCHIRNAMLQKSLRESSWPIPIEQEYPVALSGQDFQFSKALFVGNELACHMNVMPRALAFPKALRQPGKSGQVLLVGNVATQEKFRGKGLMKKMFESLFAKAEPSDTFILWSELNDFYHKLGFKPFGRELRYIFHKPEISVQIPILDQFKLISLDQSAINQTLIEKLSVLRRNFDSCFNLVTLDRSLSDWKSLLSIPKTNLSLVFWKESLVGYHITGRGGDMQEVIHEWAFHEKITQMPELILGLFVKSNQVPDSFMVLLPGSIQPKIVQVFNKFCLQGSTENMAFAFSKDSDNQIFEYERKFFIWGLDSI